MYITTKTVRLADGGKHVRVKYTKQQQLLVAWDYDTGSEQNHENAVKAFKEKFSTDFFKDKNFCGGFDSHIEALVGHWVSTDSPWKA